MLWFFKWYKLCVSMGRIVSQLLIPCVVNSLNMFEFDIFRQFDLILFFYAKNGIFTHVILCYKRWKFWYKISLHCQLKVKNSLVVWFTTHATAFNTSESCFDKFNATVYTYLMKHFTKQSINIFISYDLYFFSNTKSSPFAANRFFCKRLLDVCHNFFLLVCAIHMTFHSKTFESYHNWFLCTILLTLNKTAELQFTAIF